MIWWREDVMSDVTDILTTVEISKYDHFDSDSNWLHQPKTKNKWINSLWRLYISFKNYEVSVKLIT